MESSESKWLKDVFRETEYHIDSPDPKRMKFSDVSSELQEKFPAKKFNSYDVSQRAGKSRQKHFLGLERKSAE